MAADDNKAMVRRYLSAISGKDKPASVVGEYVSDEALKGHIASFEAAFPRYQLSADDLIAEGDKVVVRATFSGRHQGELMGIPPTRKDVAISLILIYRLAQGKIAEFWMQYDGIGLLQQVGAMAAPA